MNRGDIEEVTRVAVDRNRAMIRNDADEVGAYPADDWIIVGPDGRVGDRTTFLGTVKPGALIDGDLTSEDIDDRVYGDAAVVVARGISGRTYQGQPFRELERSNSVFVRQSGRWKCVLTHFSRLATPEPSSRDVERNGRPR